MFYNNWQFSVGVLSLLYQLIQEDNRHCTFKTCESILLNKILKIWRKQTHKGTRNLLSFKQFYIFGFCIKHKGFFLPLFHQTWSPSLKIPLFRRFRRLSSATFLHQHTRRPKITIIEENNNFRSTLPVSSCRSKSRQHRERWLRWQQQYRRWHRRLILPPQARI